PIHLTAHQPGKGERTMSFTSWLRTLRSARTPSRMERELRRRPSLREATCRPHLETLEDRCLLASYVLTDLGGLPGGRASYANDINAAGQVVGWASPATGQAHAVLWNNRTIIDLGRMLPFGSSSAVAINDRGQIAGWSSAGTNINGQSATH